MFKLQIKFDYIAIFVFLAIFSVSLISFCFAEDGDSGMMAPEPGSLTIISTGGFFVFMVRFARRRFQELKRTLDILVSVTGLILSAPLVAFVSIVIKIVSHGPVFFKQTRVGLGGKIFNIYKLRTMKVDAEKDSGPVWAEENDPRLIKFGEIIRKTHIDEIPQFINVLKGEMSIIGPRPERPAIVKNLEGEIVEYRKRLRVKPGITGLAQVWHKYDETIKDVKKKIKLDLLYIRKMCLWVDMRILALTVVAVLTGKGAR